MKTRKIAKSNESEEYSKGIKQQSIIDDKHTSKSEFTQFDAKGTKLNTQIQTFVHHSKQTLKQEEWEKIKMQRSASLIVFNQMTSQTAMIKSKVFAIYLGEISNALIELEKLRRKLNLSYSSEDGSIWKSIDIIQLFVFGITNDVYENKPVPDCFKYLICLWEWSELIALGKNERLKKRIEDEYLLYTQEPKKKMKDKKQDEIAMQQKTQDWVLIRPSMIAHHSLGCLLAPHIPTLDRLLRQPIRDFIESDNFPIFKDLIIPEDEKQYSTVILQYSFTLHNPLIPLPENYKLAPFTAIDAQCAISIDGPLTKLFTQKLSSQITDKFTLLALKNS